MSIPLVVSTSYLPSQNTELRRHRFENHIKALTTHLKDFGSVGCLLSGYNDDEVNVIKSMGVDVLHHSYKPRKKSYKQNKVLEKLYRSQSLRAVLLTDDDVVCYDPETVATMKGLLQNPETMSAPCVASLCLGRASSSYFHADRREIMPSPLSMCGWGLLIRSDFGVMYDLDVLDPYDVDDLVLRVTAAAKGRLVTLDSGLRMTPVITLTQLSSVLTDFVMKRKIGLVGQRRMLVDKYPKLFVKSKDYLRFSYNVPSIRQSIMSIKCGRLVHVPFYETKTGMAFVFNEGGYDKWSRSMLSSGVQKAKVNDQLDAMSTLIDSKQYRVNRAIIDGVTTVGDLMDAAGVSMVLVLNQLYYLQHNGHVELIQGKTKKTMRVKML